MCHSLLVIPNNALWGLNLLCQSLIILRVPPIVPENYIVPVLIHHT